MNLDQQVDQAERIAVVGSPSSTGGLALDILAGAVNRKLVGELALFRYTQDGLPHYALGQITEVKLRNVWHEDPTMRSLIRQRGRVDAVSERQDTHQGEMTVSAVFCRDGNTYRPSILGTVPATGTPIHLVTDDVLGTLLSPYRPQLFYLGRVYGSTPKLPLWFKHFDSGPDGAGEAYHLGIFGKTGSGKSVLAKMIILAYARYPRMALLVLDPQGEFAKDLRGEPTGEFRLPMKKVLGHLQKPASVISVRNLVLDRWELFQQILAESRFFRELQVLTADKVTTACDVFVEAIKKAGIPLAGLYLRSNFDRCWNLLKRADVQNKIYAREGEAAKRFAEAIQEANPEEIFSRLWTPIALLFRRDREGVYAVEDLLGELFVDQSRRPLIIIDLSVEQAIRPVSLGPLFDSAPGAEHQLFWNETIQMLVIKRLLDGVVTAAQNAYKENRSLNTLVLIDEAHRLAPREISEGLEGDKIKAVRRTLEDAVRTTRKYGVGWMFISQTLSSLDREIVDQLRIMFFGFGLSVGQEFQRLKELVGSQSTALSLYQLFRDPHSAFDTTSREYSFMTQGPVSPLSFAGTPLFFNAFNTVRDFLEANGWGTVGE